MKDFSNDEIRAICADIKASKKEAKEKERHYSDKYAEFKHSCPRLFDNILDDQFDLKFLQYMLDKRTDAANNVVDMEEMDKEVYGTLSKHYLPANLQPQNQ